MVYRLDTGADSGTKKFLSSLGMTIFITIGFPIIGALITSSDLTLNPPNATAQGSDGRQGAVLGASTEVTDSGQSSTTASDTSASIRTNTSTSGLSNRISSPANPVSEIPAQPAQDMLGAQPPSVEETPPAPDIPPVTPQDPPAEEPPLEPPMEIPDTDLDLEANIN